MISSLVFDFSRVLLFPKDTSYFGKLNPLHQELSNQGKYSVFDHFFFNDELLGYLESIKDRYGLYIFTAGTIQETPEIRERMIDIFRRVFTVQDSDLGKGDPQAYRWLAKEIQREPSEILFIDDDFANVQAAKQVGMNAVLFENNQQLFEKLGSYINVF